MNKIVISASMLCLMFACNPCDPPIVINAPLPQNIIEIVPYENGEYYEFKHSEGLVISFKTKRERFSQLSDCNHCCETVYKHEWDMTELTATYPIFTIQTQLSNPEPDYTISDLKIGNYYFLLPTPDTEPHNTIFADSLLIEGKYYYNVFVIKTSGNYYYADAQIHADSIYYNYKNGLLKIIMTNEEYYTIHE